MWYIYSKAVRSEIKKNPQKLFLSGKQGHLNEIPYYWCNFSGNYKIASTSSQFSDIYSYISTFTAAWPADRCGDDMI